MDYLTELFCQIDDFCKTFKPQLQNSLITTHKKIRQRATSASLSELMTIAILFHKLRYRQFKIFYNDHIKGLLWREFPNMPSYNRCIELMPRCLMGLFAFFQSIKKSCTGISFIDSTRLAVCNNRRIEQSRMLLTELKSFPARKALWLSFAPPFTKSNQPINLSQYKRDNVHTWFINRHRLALLI